MPEATNSAALNLALSSLTAAQRNGLGLATAALDALAQAIDRLAPYRTRLLGQRTCSSSPQRLARDINPRPYPCQDYLYCCDAYPHYAVNQDAGRCELEQNCGGARIMDPASPATAFDGLRADVAARPTVAIYPALHRLEQRGQIAGS